MGQLMNANCSCGFETMVYQGRGMMTGADYNSQGFTCNACNAIFSHDVNSKEIKCEECASKDVLLLGAEGTYKITDSTEGLILAGGSRYKCPKCKKYTVALTPGGMWD